jgi:uncharacterized RDD family membrane protein YckC
LKEASIRHPAKQIAFVLVLLLTASCCWSAPKLNLFAQGDVNGGLWLTHIGSDPTVEGKPLVSIVRYRGPQDSDWIEAGRLEGRVVGTAVVTSQLAVLLDTGQWVLLWPDGSMTGTPLPGNSPIRALGSDGDTLWALGEVSGKLKPATRPTTRRRTVGATRPATTRAVDVEVEAPAAVSPVPAFEPPDTVEPRIILFKLDRDLWTPVARINAPIDADFAVTGYRGQPTIAARNKAGTLRLFDQSRNFDDIAIGDATRFSLLWHEGSMLLWTADDKGPGEIQRRVKGESPQPLTTKGPPDVDVHAALAIATGRLRMLYLARDPKIDKPDSPPRVWEQKFDLATFTPVDKPVQQSFPLPVVDSSVQMALRAIMLSGMVIAMVISYQHRKTVRELLEKGDYPEPASLARRAAAGAIDMSTMLISGYLGHLAFQSHPNPYMPVEAMMAAAWIGYLVYTTVTELMLGRTIGKIVTGLKVVGLDGSPATRGMILQRNLLRVTDMFPSPMLLLVILSPLRQRVGDIAAGTLVVEDKKENSEPGEKQ